MNDDLDALTDSLQRAARAAGDLLREGYQTAGTIEFDSKGASDFVTHFDRAAEQAIIDTIRKTHPELGFLGEESGITAGQGGELTVVIDPLDGTNNFLHKVPHFSVSIAVERVDELLIGVVYQPLLDEMLWAVRGRGAFLGDQRLGLRSARPLNEMLVGTCLPYHGKGDCPLSCRQMAHLMPQVSGIRSPGSAALEIAYVALGRFDAFWSQGAELEWWDIAAAIVIAREAGCIVTDLSGNSSPQEWRSLLVTHPDRHGPLVECLSH